MTRIKPHNAKISMNFGVVFILVKKRCIFAGGISNTFLIKVLENKNQKYASIS